jgi:hypothetical protein
MAVWLVTRLMPMAVWAQIIGKAFAANRVIAAHNRTTVLLATIGTSFTNDSQHVPKSGPKHSIKISVAMTCGNGC